MSLPIVRNSNKLQNIAFRKLDLFPSSYAERDISAMSITEINSFQVT
jgi:hypothetical protein